MIYLGSEDKAPHILNPGNSWRRVTSTSLWPSIPKRRIHHYATAVVQNSELEAAPTYSPEMLQLMVTAVYKSRNLRMILIDCKTT
jgi:hypothetical protein